MSIRAINWARKVGKDMEMPPDYRHLLLTLCCFHNEKTGDCNPSYETLSGEVGFCERKVKYMMKALHSAGLVSSRACFIGRKQTSNQYSLFGQTYGAKWASGVHHTTPLRGAHVFTPQGCTSVHTIGGSLLESGEVPSASKKASFR